MLIENFVPILIEEFQYIFQASIEEEAKHDTSFRNLRFNLAIVLLDLYDKIGRFPYSHVGIS